MKIGLIDVDAVNNHGPKFPNLALMRISAWHKAQGDDVEWWWTDFIHYDIVYMSKVFSDTYSPDVPEPMNADRVIKGGTGYAISLVDGKEAFDKSRHVTLPEEIEQMFPDYSIYPQFDFAVSMTSRGCPRGCSFCHVAARICELCEAIKRYSTETGKHNRIALWCKEIMYLNEMDRNLRYDEKCKVWREEKDGKLQEMP